jgi:hypothetical protein
MDKNSPRSPISPTRQSNTATILTSRVARRNSLMSHRDAQGGGSELRHGKPKKLKQMVGGGLNTPNEIIQFSNTVRGPQQFQKYI